MKKEDRSPLEDRFRDVLYDLEADVDAGCWEAIESRLPKQKATPFFLNIRFWAAAAAAIALLISIGTLRDTSEPQLPAPTLQAAQQPLAEEKASLPTQTVKEASPSVGQLFAASIQTGERKLKALAQTPAQEAAPTSNQADSTPQPTPQPMLLATTQKAAQKTKFISTKSNETKLQIAENDTPKKTKRWSFGMGGGSLSASSGMINPLGTATLCNASTLRASSLSRLKNNSVAYRVGEMEKTDVHHKKPLSIGLGVGYSLNSRWTLQSGLQYSYLASEWNTHLIYSGEAKQQLHFVGIPLSISYTIAEWDRLRFYASAGMLAELNVSGRVQSKLYAEDGSLLSELSERRRMKQLQWSTHAAVGASYPLIRFVSIYAEAGLSYYISNGSTVETYYTDKAFTPAVRLGFRFGF